MRRWLRRLGYLVALLVLCEVAIRVFVHFADPEAGLYRADASAGWITRPKLHQPIHLSKFGLRFLANTNSLGLRGDDEILPRATDELRILVLGDSFTWGIGVESNETFPAQLERRLRERLGRTVTVINAGMPCYGTSQELAFYRAYGAQFQPDVVVLAYYSNDDGDNVTRFVYRDGFLWEDPTLFFGHPSFLIELLHRLRARPQKPDGRPLTLNLIAELRAACAAKHHSLYVLDIPARETTRFVEPPERPSRRQPLALPPTELIEMFAEVQAQTETPYLREHHLSPRGHTLAADVLARELGRRGTSR